MQWEEFKARDVFIDNQGNYIRTVEVGDPKNQTMVLIHGYGGSSVKFWKIVKPLSQKYHILMIDIIGMGGSSRPPFDLKDPEKID
jgi:cardiolipin-specific phospholipase